MRLPWVGALLLRSLGASSLDAVSAAWGSSARRATVFGSSFGARSRVQGGVMAPSLLLRGARSPSLTAAGKRGLHLHHTAAPTRQGIALRAPLSSSTGQKRLLASTVAAVFRKAFLDAPIQLLVGVTIGGLGASTAGMLFILHYTEIVDMSRLMDSLKSGKVQSGPTAGAGAGTGEGAAAHGGHTWEQWIHRIPFPAWTVIGWTVSLAITATIAFARARYQMKYRDFVRNVNFSLTMLNPRAKYEKVVLRTVKECKLEEVLNSPLTEKIVVDGARSMNSATCTFVPLPANSSDLIINQFLNHISTLFADKYVLQDNSVPYTETKYYFGITYNVDAERMHKLRVVIANEATLNAVRELKASPDFSKETSIPQQLQRRFCTLHELATLVDEQRGLATGDVPVVRYPADDTSLITPIGSFNVPIFRTAGDGTALLADAPIGTKESA